MVQLVLWDIDHTLVTTRGVDAELFGRAFREVTGCDIRRQARREGATDAGVFHDTAKLHELTASRADFERFATVLAQQYMRQGPALHERGLVMPGAPAALSGVTSLSGVAQTVVTDNLRGAAEVKLRIFGMDSQIDWSIGAFAEDSDEHAVLVTTAIERAAQVTGLPVPPSEVVLIGDEPSDVAAGQAAGVRVVAVASGRSDEAALREAGAETVLPGLDETEELLKILIAEG
jgi:phosphoglycolate phosphatase